MSTVKQCAIWSSIAGGLFCLLSYRVPWVVGYSTNWDDSYMVRPLAYEDVWSGHQNLEDALWPAIPYGMSRNLTLLVAALPLLMALIAMIAGAVVWVRRSVRLSRSFTWVYWTATFLGTLALLVMTYALDPWNLFGIATLSHEWASPPSAAPGMLIGYAGVLAIIVGGLLLCSERETLLGRRTRAGEREPSSAVR